MRFLTSSSSSASSTITTTTTTSFDANVHNSRSTTSGCIAGVFRRLLCLNSLPTHPSDHFKDTDHDSVSVELDKLQCAKLEERVKGSAAPSIVARLMGLESFPQFDFSATQKSPNSVARSRSMNSVDLMKELASIQEKHRRVKSFREIPTFVELQDENFFILSFENGGETGKLGAKSRKSEMGSVQKQTKQSIKEENSKSKNNKRRESVYEKNKENLHKKTVSDENLDKAINSRKVSLRVVRGDDAKLKDSSNILHSTNSSCRNSFSEKDVEKFAKPINHKPETESLLGRRRMKKRKDDCLPVKKIETEPDSENSSPSSVLDIMKFPEELPRLSNSKSRRTLSEDLENYRKLNHECNDNGCISIASCKSRTFYEVTNIELRKDDHGSRTCVQMWGEICKVAARNITQSNWIVQNKDIQKLEEYKEISGELEMQIVDELVGEAVYQLVGNYNKSFDL